MQTATNPDTMTEAELAEAITASANLAELTRLQRVFVRRFGERAYERAMSLPRSVEITTTYGYHHRKNSRGW